MMDYRGEVFIDAVIRLHTYIQCESIDLNVYTWMSFKLVF